MLWELQEAPYGDVFRERREEALSEFKQPLRLATCESCDLLQLKDETDIFYQIQNYSYQTNVTVGLGEYYKDVAIKMLNTHAHSSAKTILDIGSNDGSFLNFFLEQGFEVLGVEPSPFLPTATKEYTINDFFSLELSKKIKKQYPQGFDLISVNYTLANVPNIRDFLLGLKTLLADEGRFSIITGYHPDQFTIGMFDYIGHDHLSYFSLRNLIEMFSSIGLEVYEAVKTEHKGGSIHVIGGKRRAMAKRNSIRYVLQREEWMWRSNEMGISSLKERTEQTGFKCRELLSKVNHRLLGIGASVSTSHLINEFNISHKLDALVDDDPLKLGKFSPHHAIEVIPFSHKNVNSNSNAMLLAWQHTNVLLDRLRESGFKGEVLIPLPQPRILVID